MIQHYLTVALRQILKNKTQYLLSTLGLAVGVLCFSLCSYLVRYWMNQDNAFIQKERIAEIAITSPKGMLFSGTPPYLGPELQNKQLKEIERITVAAYNRSQKLSFEITGNKVLPYEIPVMETDTNFLTVFGNKLLLGDARTINNMPNVFVLSQSTAQRIYGKTNPIGKKVIGEGEIAYTVGGVFEDLPGNNSIDPHKPVEILALSVLNGKLSNYEKGITGCTTYALLSSGSNASDLEKNLRTSKYTTQLFDEEESWVRSFPLGHTKYMVTGMKIFYGFIFFIGLLILLSTLLNYFAFFTNRFFNRIKEFSIRKGIGGNKRDLFGLLFTELVLSLLLSGILSLCLAELLIPGFRFNYFRIQVDFDVWLLQKQIVEYILICMFVAALICGTVCHRLNRASLIEGIRISRHRARNILLGIQFFITLLFFSGAVFAMLQTREGEQRLFSSLTEAEKDRIFFIRTDYPYMEANRDVLISKWKSNSLVEDILQIQDKLTNTRINNYSWEDGKSSTPGSILYTSANVGHFLNLKATTGVLELEPNCLLLNENFMQVLKENPVGKTIHINKEPTIYKVNGVTSSLLRFVDGSSYFSALAIALLDKGGNCYVRFQEGKEQEGKAFLTNTITEFLPESIQPEIYSLKDECQQVQRTERLLRNIFLFFGIVCLLINVLGIYAAISQDTEQRKKEVAIRKINGASVWVILKLFSRLYLILLLVATLFVFPIMWLATNEILSSWTIRFNYNNPCPWIGIFLFIAGIIGLTIIFRILKTARLNPAETIKTE